MIESTTVFVKRFWFCKLQRTDRDSVESPDGRLSTDCWPSRPLVESLVVQTSFASFGLCRRNLPLCGPQLELDVITTANADSTANPTYDNPTGTASREVPASTRPHLRKNMPRIFQHKRTGLPFCLLALMALISMGCVAEPETTDVKEAIAPIPVAPTNKDSSDYHDMSLSDLVLLAEDSLGKNDIESVKAAIAEIRSRKEQLTWRMKMDVARVLFGAGAMKDSAEVYDEILAANPNSKPQFWQRGLALYYANEFEKGADQFESHQTYNSQDVENSVWHLLCQSRLTSVQEARKKMIPIEHDSRVPMKQVFDMFAGTGSPEEVLDACGYKKSKPKLSGQIYHGLIYVGLFHEMMGNQKASQESMIEALTHKPDMPGLMGHVAEGHLRARIAYPADQSDK